MTAKQGYFGVAVEAARSLTESERSPELLAAYLAMRRHTYGKGRDRTAAGARAIRQSIGCTDYRSKRLLADLKALRFGPTGSLGAVIPMSEWNKTHGTNHSDRRVNADVYMLPPWQGGNAYLPASLMDKSGEHPSPISKLCQAAIDPASLGDALHVLVHAYAAVDYGGVAGVNPSDFVGYDWLTEGRAASAPLCQNLGHIGERSGVHFWLVQVPHPDGQAFAGEALRIFGKDAAQASARLASSLELLCKLGFLTRMAVVTDGREAYPLWTADQEHRETLTSFGINSNLVDDIERAANNANIPAVPNRASGLLICATTSAVRPRVQSIYAPAIIAPTPVNLDGLQEMATRTRQWQYRLHVL